MLLSPRDLRAIFHSQGALGLLIMTTWIWETCTVRFCTLSRGLDTQRPPQQLTLATSKTSHIFFFPPAGPLAFPVVYGRRISDDRPIPCCPVHLFTHSQFSIFHVFLVVHVFPSSWTSLCELFGSLHHSRCSLSVTPHIHSSSVLIVHLNTFSAPSLAWSLFC